MSTTDPLSADPLAALTGPGGRFELAEEDARGVRMPVFRHRARSLPELLEASAGYGAHDYLVTAERRISFAEHRDRVAALAAGLRTEYGVGRGDRIGIAAANSPEWITAFWAAVALGGIAVGYNAWWSRRELAHGTELTGPSVIVADARRAELLADSPVPVVSTEGGIAALAAAYAGAELPAERPEEDDPAVILFTSGTSGRPKGAVHSHRSLCSVVEYHRLGEAAATAMGHPVAPRDRRYLLTLPLFHIASLHNLAVPRLATGSTAVLHEGAFDVDRVLALVEQEGVTNWGAVPTQAHRLLEHGGTGRYDLSSLTSFTLASAPSSPAFKQRVREMLPGAGAALVDSYGSTETATALTAASPADLAEAPGTLGRPVAGVQLEVRGPDGRTLPEGAEGEVCARSAYNMLGYWRDPESTRAAVDADGWLRTGDLGVLEGGRLRLSSRRSDLIIRGGENVYPAEVEAVLAEHPDVAECAVFGADHADLGQQVAAVVVARPPAVPAEEELRAFAADRLAYFKVPSRWRITTDPLPRNATGKVIRTAVRALG
ncbi:steroid-24-oyl-CoA synthetase [Nocardiopsis coralliicola]